MYYFFSKISVKPSILTMLFGCILCTSAVSTSAQGAMVQNWITETHTGKQISLYEETKKGRMVVAVFWATWCRYCHALLPEINALKRELEENYEGNVTFVTMNIWEDGNPLLYMKQQQFDMEIVLNAETIAQQYKLRATPGVFVIDEQRRVVYRREVGDAPKQVVEAIRQVVAQR